MGNHPMDDDGLGDYRVIDLVNREFEQLKLENIDFARHLKSDVALNKKVTKLPNGRPEKAEYYNGTDLIAVIEFDFTADTENLLQRRREWLKYYKTDGTTSAAILIKDKIFDSTDLVDGEAVIEERVKARTSIVSSMKAFLSGVLMQGLGQTLPQVIATIKPFWDEYKVERDDFIELGSPDWKDDLIAVDLGTTPHTWMAIDIGGGVTIRDYMVSRLSY